MDYFVKRSLKYAFKDTFGFPPWICFSLFCFDCDPDDS